MASSSLKKITVKTSEGEIFQVDEALVNESQTIKHLIDEKCNENAILLPHISSETLSKVIEYLKKHVEFDAAAGMASKSLENSLKAWDAEFMKVDDGTLYDLILAANYLDIKSLIDLACQTVAEMIKGKSVEQILETFDVQNDFTPEEEVLENMVERIKEKKIETENKNCINVMRKDDLQQV